MNTQHYEAVLLLGPTGSGKTPLGRTLEERGWAGRRCLHFDFGENLRQAARGEPDEIVSRQDVDFLRQILQTGALLEDRDFPLAERILQSFLVRRDGVGSLFRPNARPLAESLAETDSRPLGGSCRAAEVASARVATLIVLNGLPRHVGQAQNVAQLLQVRAVVSLACPPELVLARIAANAGGDRTDRLDDDLAAVRKKLLIFQERTTPLIEFYREREARILRLDVSVDTTAEAMWETIAGSIREFPTVRCDGPFP